MNASHVHAGDKDVGVPRQRLRDEQTAVRKTPNPHAVRIDVRTTGASSPVYVGRFPDFRLDALWVSASLTGATGDDQSRTAIGE